MSYIQLQQTSCPPLRCVELVLVKLSTGEFDDTFPAHLQLTEFREVIWPVLWTLYFQLYIVFIDAAISVKELD